MSINTKAAENLRQLAKRLEEDGQKMRKRVMRAGEQNKGVRLTAEEVQILCLFHVNFHEDCHPGAEAK